MEISTHLKNSIKKIISCFFFFTCLSTVEQLRHSAVQRGVALASKYILKNVNQFCNWVYFEKCKSILRLYNKVFFKNVNQFCNRTIKYIFKNVDQFCNCTIKYIFKQFCNCTIKYIFKKCWSILQLHNKVFFEKMLINFAIAQQSIF